MRKVLLDNQNKKGRNLSIKHSEIGKLELPKQLSLLELTPVHFILEEFPATSPVVMFHYGNAIARWMLCNR